MSGIQEHKKKWETMANRLGILDKFGSWLVLIAAMLCMAAYGGDEPLVLARRGAAAAIAASAQESQVKWPMEELRKAPKVYDALEYKTNGVEVASAPYFRWLSCAIWYDDQHSVRLLR